MSFLRWYFLLLAMSWACQAAEVIAWKIPLVNYCQFGLEEGAAVRMKDAPEASVFFNEGDELWDVSKEGPAPGKLPDLDWIVWNGSSGRLIAKGELKSLKLLHIQIKAADVTGQARCLLEVFRAASDKPFSGRGVPEVSWSLISDSGQRFRGKQTGVGGTLEVEGEIFFGAGTADLRFKAISNLRDQPESVVETSVRLASGKPLWIAGDWNGEYGLDLRATTTIELLDGTLREDLTLKQVGGGKERIDLDPKEVGPIPVAGGLFRALRVPGDSFPTLQPGCSGAAEIQPPEILSEWMYRPVGRAEGVLKESMGALLAGEFAGYDPELRMLYFYTRDQGRMKAFGDLFIALVCGPGPMGWCRLDGPQRVCIAGKSGQKQQMLRQDKGTVIQSTEVEPIMDWVETTRIRISHKTMAEFFDTSFQVRNGVFIPIAGPRDASGFRFMAEVIPEPR